MPETIVIDPGHGGATEVGSSKPNNARGPQGLLEKKATFDVALAVGQRLMQLGYTVRLTREGDVNLGLAARAHVARDLQAKAFVSIHFNGNVNPSVQGTETFVHVLHTDNSALLATSVQSHTRNATGYTNRGVKKAFFGVVNPANHFAGTSACLVEVSFMTDPADEAKLRTQSYISQVGRAIAQGIDDFVQGRSTNPAPIEEFPAPINDGDF